MRRPVPERSAALCATPHWLAIEPLRLALIGAALAAAAWPAHAILLPPPPPPVCEVVAEPGPAAARVLAGNVQGETWRRRQHPGGVAQHVAVKVERSSTKVCTARTESFFEGASGDRGSSAPRSNSRVGGDPWGGRAAYRWAGIGPCPLFEPWRVAGGTRAYVVTDPRTSDARFLRVASYGGRLDAPIAMISQRQWLFGLWRTYDVTSAQGPLGYYTRRTLLEAVGRLWLLKARSGQVVH